MSMTKPTQDELRLVQSYQRILDDVARCAQAIRDGDWPLLAGTATELSGSAVHLSVAAGELRDPATQPRSGMVLDTLARQHASPITRLLHPPRPDSVARTTMTDPFTHPGS
jgi:hypothetical protein